MIKFIFPIAAVILNFSTAAATEVENQWIEKYIASIPDLLKNPEAFRKVIQTFANRYKDLNLDVIIGLDSRGFIFGTALAYEMSLPFVMIRKSGKLPRQVEKISYNLEYGSACFEIELDSINPGDRVLIMDDLLATGGSANAASTLVEKVGAHVVEVACLIELKGLHGRENLKAPFFSLISVEVDE